MAFGLSPKHTEVYPLGDLTAAQFLVLAIEAAKKLEWNVGFTSENGFTAFTAFSMRSWSEEVNVRIDGSSATVKSECTGNQIADWGKNKKNIETLIATVDELKQVRTPEELAQKYEELEPGLVSEDSDGSSQPQATKEGITSILAIFKPVEGYFVTPIIININIALFILMVISGVGVLQPDNESLLQWGANFRPLTLEGQGWRLLSNCFIHIGVLHLLMNMYALLYIGLLLEPHLGKIRFAAAYLLTGIVASLASLWWHDLSISAGASGAIFGMYGVFLALLTTNLIDKAARKALLTSIAVFVGYNILNGVKPNSGIDNAAHIGGLLSGLVLGYALIPGLKKPGNTKLKFGTIGALSAVVLIAAFLVYRAIPNDLGTYDARIKEFTAMETAALGIYNLPPDTSVEQILYEIRHTGIENWNKSIQLIASLEELDLPSEIHNKNRLLTEYCELRIKSYELLYKALQENTDAYNAQLEDYNMQIESKIKALGVGQ